MRPEIARLGAEDYDVREASMDALRAIGTPAGPFLLKAVKSGNEEVKNRAEILVGEIVGETTKVAPEGTGEAEVGMEALADDEVVTQRFTLRGRVLEEEYRIRSLYGQLQFDRADITGIAFDAK